MSSMRKRYQAKRVLAMILAIAMVVTVAPVTAYAEEPDSAGTSVQSEPQSTQSGNTLDEEEGTGDPDNSLMDEGDPGTTPTEQSYKLDVSGVQTVYTYDGNGVFLEGTVKVLNQDDEVYETLDDWSNITTAWKQGDTTVTVPKDAGSYTVKLTAKVDGKDVSADVPVTIEPAEVTLTLAELNVKPGTPVEQVKAPEISDVSADVTSSEVANNDVVLTVKGIRDAVTAEPVAAGTKLSKRSDYMMDLTPAWAEGVVADKQKNYKLPENVAVRVNVSTLITTRVTVTLAEKWQGKTEGGETTEGAVEFVYDNSEPELKTPDDYTVKVEYQTTDETGKGVWAELEGATVEGAWYDADGEVELEEAPVDAGTYTYRLTYSGDNGETYAENHADITVEILPATLTVEITNSKELEEVQNTSLQDVLNDVEYKVTDADGKDVTAAMKQQYVWGSSYADSNTLQVYVPAFTLQVSEKKGPWKDLTDDDYCLQGGEDYEYRVIYDGQKAVYNADGSFAARTGINDDDVMGYNANYTTDETPTADDKALKVTVKAGEAVTVDAAALIGTDAGAGAVDPLTAAAKTYDGKTLYGNRSAYKKAAVKKADGTSVSASSAELVYTWQSWNEYEYYIDGDYVKDRLDMQILSENIKNKFVTDVEEDFYKGEDCWNDIDYNPIPKNAGVYRLKITYTDKTEDGSYYFAKEPAYVYYVIEKEKIKITPTTGEDGEYKALENRYLSAVRDEREHGITYEMKTVPAEGEGQIIDTDGLNLSVNWWVEETVTPKEGAASKQNKYELGEDKKYHIKDAEENTYAYKLYANGIESVYDDDEASEEFADNHTVYASAMADDPDSTPTEAGAKKKKRTSTLLSDMADIKVTPMGTAKIELKVDDTKWGKPSKVYDAKPFTLEDLVKDGLVTVNQVAEDGTKTPVAEDPKELLTWTVSDGGYGEWSIDKVKDGGTYTLYASFPGNETYAPITDEGGNVTKKEVGTYTITPRELTVTVTELPTQSYNMDEGWLEDIAGYVPATDGRTDGRAGYEAGVSATDVANSIAVLDQVLFTVEGYAEEDAQYFQRTYDEYGTYGIPAWSDDYDNLSYPSFELRDKKDQKNSYESSLKRDSEYNIWYSGSLSDEFRFYEWGEKITIDFTKNYTVAAKPASDYFPTFKGNATVSTAEWSDIKAVASRSTANNTTDSMSQSLELLEAVPYTNAITLSAYDNKKIEGNLVAVQITPPREFTTLNHNKMIYQNAIENAGGYVVEDPVHGDYFTAVFDANCDADPEFSICWDDGYVEKIVLKLKDAAKLGDLENAVMPKSLAFNAAPGKIAVGETVQLDVKITKKQMGDLVYLGYESTDEDVLSVTDTGLVTARKLGKATVTVYPLHKTAGGQTEKIPGAKEAKAVITVTAVTAPKPVKAVETHEDTVKLDYPKLADGYRREIYVVDNSKGSATEKTKKAADIEKLVVGLKNGSWKGVFAAEPIFLDSADEALNRSTSKYDDHPYTALVEGLAPNTSYTVYIRNVAALHTLNDVNILEEGASGTTVSVKTTKSEVTKLEAELRAADGVRLMGHETGGGDVGGSPVYGIDLTKTKTAQVDVSGLFKDMAADSSADDDDETWKSLPLDRADKEYYEEPSLEYGWYESVWNDKKGYSELQFVQKNDYMSVDKKGKVKFTGVTGNGAWMKFADGSGGCYLIVRDTKTGETAYVGLHPDAQAQSVTAIKKSYTLDVGRGMSILNLLKYKMPGMTFTAYAKRNVAVTKEMMDLASAQGFTLSSSGYLTAVQPGASLELTLKDIGVAQAGYESTASATVTFKTSALQPVKALKAYDVNYDRFGLRFTHQGVPEAFLVEIRDGNGLVFSKSYDRDDFYSYYSPEENTLGYIRDKKGNITAYQYRIDPGDLSDLTKETQYTVTVTAQYGDAGSSKAASTKVKTTKIPAVNAGIDHFDVFGNPVTKYDENEKVYKPVVYYGGMPIKVSENTSNSLPGSSNSLTVQSGSSYTLTAQVSNRGRISDTLVWSVSDAKIATVKAAAGSYAITLKGVKPGTVTLEVKSKILGNKVVARYKIKVVAVGDAYKTFPNNMRYYGDNEQEDFTAPSVPGVKDPAKDNPLSLPIGVDDNRKVTDSSEHIFTFTAPEDGQYTFGCTGGGYNVRLKKEGESYNTWYTASISLDWMAAGDTVKLYSKDGSTPYYVTVKQTVRLADNALTEGQDKVFTATSYEYAYMTFTAPEDGVYRFTAYQGDVENGEKSTSYLYTSLENMKSYSSDQSGQEIEHTFKAGETVYISVYMQPGYTYTVKTEKLSQPLTPDAPISIDAGKETYLQWTAEKDGVYEFTLSEATTSVAATVALTTSDMDITLTVAGNEVSLPIEIKDDTPIFYEAKAGDPVVLKITNKKKSDALTVKVSQPKAKEIEDLPATAKLPVGGAI